MSSRKSPTAEMRALQERIYSAGSAEDPVVRAELAHRLRALRSAAVEPVGTEVGADNPSPGVELQPPRSRLTLLITIASVLAILTGLAGVLIGERIGRTGASSPTASHLASLPALPRSVVAPVADGITIVHLTSSDPPTARPTDPEATITASRPLIGVGRSIEVDLACQGGGTLLVSVGDGTPYRVYCASSETVTLTASGTVQGSGRQYQVSVYTRQRLVWDLTLSSGRQIG